MATQFYTTVQHHHYDILLDLFNKCNVIQGIAIKKKKKKEEKHSTIFIILFCGDKLHPSIS